MPEPVAPSESVLVEQARAGDRRALDQLVRAHYGPLRALLLRSGSVRPSDVEDVVQETFLRAFAAVERYEHRGHLRTWLYRIALNLARDRRRRAGRLITREDVAALADLEGEDPAGGDPGQEVLARMEGARLAEALDSLPPTHREVVLLRFYADRSLPEIARVMGCPVGTVKSRLHYALRKLRAILARSAGAHGGSWGAGDGPRDDREGVSAARTVAGGGPGEKAGRGPGDREPEGDRGLGAVRRRQWMDNRGGETGEG